MIKILFKNFYSLTLLLHIDLPVIFLLNFLTKFSLHILCSTKTKNMCFEKLLNCWKGLVFNIKYENKILVFLRPNQSWMLMTMGMASRFIPNLMAMDRYATLKITFYLHLIFSRSVKTLLLTKLKILGDVIGQKI